MSDNPNADIRIIARKMYVTLKGLSEIDWFYEPATYIQPTDTMIEGYQAVSVIITGVICKYCGQEAAEPELIPHPEDCYVRMMEEIVREAEQLGFRLEG